MPAIYIDNIDYTVNVEMFCAGPFHLPKLKPQKLTKAGRFSYSVSGIVAHLPKVTSKLGGVVTANKIVGSYSYNMASTARRDREVRGNPKQRAVVGRKARRPTLETELIGKNGSCWDAWSLHQTRGDSGRPQNQPIFSSAREQPRGQSTKTGLEPDSPGDTL